MILSVPPSSCPPPPPWSYTQKAVASGSIEPIEPAALSSGIARLYPGCTLSSVWARALCLGAQTTLLLTAFVLLPFVTLILKGDAVAMPGYVYLFLKPAYASLAAFLSYPGLFLGCLSANNFPLGAKKSD